ncbi:MAG: ComEC/Rec2 family competence protein, partial [Planctomycetota bacterium]
RETFLLTGTVHLLAISGLHVGILAGLFFVLYRADLISRNTCLICTILFVVFYAWLVEFRPPVSRAAILIVLFCLARLIGRTSSSFNWLAIAGLLVLVINPADLFQVGPQLSFLAVATIVAGFRWIAPRKSSDPLQRLIDSTRPFPVRLLYWSGEKVRAAFLVSAIVWMVAMPLVAIRFHLSAPVALIVNPILLIPIALALYGGLGTLVFGSFFPPAGAICGRLCDWNLSVVEWCIALATNVPGGHSWTAGPAVVSVIAFYAGMFLFAVWPATRVSGKYVLIWVMCWTVFGWLVPQRILEARHRDAEHALVATFIDVGHGTSVLLQLPDGRNILYDAGSFGSANYAVQNVSSVLWHENVTHLDSVVVSHADVDHFNALPELMKRFSIGSLIVSYPMSNSDSESVAVLLEAARSNGIRVETVSSGDRLETDSLVDIKVLNPPEAGNGESDNADSIVLLIEHSEKRLLLTGDLEGDALFELMSGSPLPFDIAMAPHHGSLNSHPQTFARWCTPDYVVISGSVRKTGDEVTKQFESAGAEVLSTGLDGAVRFEIGEEVRARTWNDGGW